VFNNSTTQSCTSPSEPRPIPSIHTLFRRVQVDPSLKKPAHPVFCRSPQSRAALIPYHSTSLLWLRSFLELAPTSCVRSYLISFFWQASPLFRLSPLPDSASLFQPFFCLSGQLIHSLCFFLCGRFWLFAGF